MKKHQKQAKLIKPEIGFFGRNEIAFLGAPCGLIESLVDKIIEELKGEISQEPDADNSETLSIAMDYYKLINSFSLKLGRVMSRYN